MTFQDRHDAGRRLAPLLADLRAERPIVVGIARGGVLVAAEVAAALQAPLDVVIVRKLGAPGNPEFAIGALAEGGVRLVDRNAVAALALTEQELHDVLARASRQLLDQLARYRGSRPALDLRDRTVIVVDDGLATGRSAIAAIESIRHRGALRVVLALPVAAEQSLRRLRGCADAVVCLEPSTSLWAVGYWYEDFTPTEDEQVTAALLAASEHR